MGCHVLLQGIFLIQGSIPSLYVSRIGRRVLHHWHRLGSPLVAQSCPALETPWTVAHQAPLSLGFPLVYLLPLEAQACFPSVRASFSFPWVSDQSCCSAPHPVIRCAL